MANRLCEPMTRVQIGVLNIELVVILAEVDYTRDDFPFGTVGG
jgi:hypothetical protein